MNFFPDEDSTRTLQRGTWPTAAYLSWGPFFLQVSSKNAFYIPRRRAGVAFCQVPIQYSQKQLLSDFFSSNGVPARTLQGQASTRPRLSLVGPVFSK